MPATPFWSLKKVNAHRVWIETHFDELHLGIFRCLVECRVSRINCLLHGTFVLPWDLLEGRYGVPTFDFAAFAGRDAVLRRRGDSHTVLRIMDT